jgi:dihydrodipicolinate synthase/N-acetylneuraminate lyase
VQNKFAQLKSALQNKVAPAMATPLEEDGYTVNTAVIPELVNFLAKRGAGGLFVGGTTGEGILLSTAERMQLHEGTVTAAAGRFPVILHVGANRMDTAVTLAQHAADIGAAAIAAVPPYFYDIHDGALLDYYQMLAEVAPETPLLLYDIPHMAVNGISPQNLTNFAAVLPTMAGIKCSRRDVQMVRKLIDALPAGQLFLVGNESAALGSLALGGTGLISGLSTAVPEPFVAMTAAFAAGDIAEAQRQQRLINQMLALLPSGARIGAIKQILAERGVPVGPAVPPRPMPDGMLWRSLERLLRGG